MTTQFNPARTPRLMAYQTAGGIGFRIERDAEVVPCEAVRSLRAELAAIDAEHGRLDDDICDQTLSADTDLRLARLNYSRVMARYGDDDPRTAEARERLMEARRTLLHLQSD